MPSHDLHGRNRTKEPKDPLGFFPLPPLPAPGPINEALALQDGKSLLSVLRGQGLTPQEMHQGLNAIDIQSWNGSGKLIGMASPFDDEGLLDESYRVATADAQPKVIVLAGRERFIEASHLGEQIPVNDDSRRADEAPLHQEGKAVPLGLLMVFPGIEALSVANPELLSLADTQVGMSLEKSHLDFELPREPEVIGIEEGDPFPSGQSNAMVSGGADAPVRLKNGRDGIAESFQDLRRLIR